MRAHACTSQQTILRQTASGSSEQACLLLLLLQGSLVLSCQALQPTLGCSLLSSQLLLLCLLQLQCLLGRPLFGKVFGSHLL